MGGTTAFLAKSGENLSFLTGMPLIADLLNLSGQVEFNHITIVGRALSGLADSLTVLLVFDIGRRVFGYWSGLLGSGLLAGAVLHIQLSHFGTFDTFLALFSTATVWSTLRYHFVPSWRNLIQIGVFGALAVGSKASAGFLALPIFAAIVLTETNSTKVLRENWRVVIQSVILRGLAVLGICLFTFALTNPFALIEYGEYFENITRQSNMIRGEYDWFFVQQYRDTPAYLYVLGQQSRWLLGLPLTVAAYAGLAWSILRIGIFRRDNNQTKSLLILLLWVVPYLVVFGSFVVKFPRYMLPITPIIILLGAAILVQTAQRWRWLALVIPVVILPTYIFAISFVNMLAVEHPWLNASRWIYENIPPASTLSLEKFDDPLPFSQVDNIHYGRAETYSIVNFDPFQEPDDEVKLAAMLTTLGKSDFLVLASARMYGVIPRFELRYPFTSAYYKALFGEELGFKPVYSAARWPTFGALTFVDDTFRYAGLPAPRGTGPDSIVLNFGFADESFRVYDHPRVIIFQNSGRMTATEMEKRIFNRLELDYLSTKENNSSRGES